MRYAILIALAACSSKSSTTSSGPRPVPKDGLAAFEMVRSVLQHPRCQNCHPAGDAPLQGDDGRIHTQNIQRGHDGKGMVGAECTTCHRDTAAPESFGPNIPPGVANWHMPPPEMPMVFAGVSAAELCAAIKDPQRNGGKDATALRKHLEDPLVTWAWKPGVGRTPPPIAYEQFVAAWHAWDAAGMPCP